MYMPFMADCHGYVLSTYGTYSRGAGLDYIIQRYLFMKDMMMSKQELKEEYKTLEGDPFLKQRMRAKQRELMKRLMMGGVKESRVVITNPTHYACALKFNELEDPAPVLVAKGKDLLAQQIKEIARKHDVPLYENNRSGTAYL
jgi:flagellar biosynthesis protein FlhB